MFFWCGSPPARYSERVRHLFATCSLIGFWLCVCSLPVRYSERVRQMFARCSPTARQLRFCVCLRSLPVRYLFATYSLPVRYSEQLCDRIILLMFC
ncbi:hypothetical protein A2U01_0010842 [Trifolium medium]|uniref:Uncharacterized protein n=1 Tax=Trifolium medium TaxID=97028 RepID=A0A392MTF6_9FABA|nr:hypothetical protein [Trifolium medium]